MLRRKVNAFIDSIYAATSNALVFDDNSWSERQKHLSTVESPLRRAAFLGIHHAVGICPELMSDLLTRDYRKGGFEVLGIGRTATVIRMGDTALKIVRSTASMSERQRQETLEDLDRDQSVLMSHLGCYAIRQNLEIIDHPLKNKRVIAAFQPVVEDFSPIEINNRDWPITLNDQQRAMVGAFVEDALSMKENTGYILDAFGSSNFGFAQNGEKFVVVDTIPIKPGCPERVTTRAEAHLKTMATIALAT